MDDGELGMGAVRGACGLLACSVFGGGAGGQAVCQEPRMGRGGLLAYCYCLLGWSLERARAERHGRGSPARGFLLCAMYFGYYGFAVRFAPKTEAEPVNRTVRKPKPNPQPKTEQTEISVRFGSVRFGLRFSAKKCPGRVFSLNSTCRGY